MVLQIAVRLYAKGKGKELGEHLKQAMNPEIRFQVEEFESQIEAGKEMKEKYSREKQTNRKLKLENEQLKKLVEIDESFLITE